MGIAKEGKQLKTIDINAKSFKANGKEYFIERGGLSQKRLIEFEKKQVSLGYGISFIELYENVKQIYELCNQSKTADIAVKSYNILKGIKNFEERNNQCLELCALFINTKDEDRRTINQDMIDQKLADWDEEGLDVVPFFQLGVGSIQDFSVAYKAVTLIVSEMEKLGKKKSQLIKKN